VTARKYRSADRATTSPSAWRPDSAICIGSGRS
jgi:hypothetical protein